SIAHDGCCLLITVTGTVDDLDIESLEAAIRQIAATHGVCNILACIEGTPALPTSAARSRATAMLRDTSGSIGRIGVVMRGTGFWSAAYRSVVSGVFFLSRAPFVAQLEGSLEKVEPHYPSYFEWGEDDADHARERFRLAVSGYFTGSAASQARARQDRG